MDDITSFEQIIGSQNIITAEQDEIGYLEDWRGNFTGSAQAVLLPRSTEHVSQILAHADAQNQCGIG